MFDDDEKPIRYHFPEDFQLDPGERVFLDKIEPGTANWSRQSEIPEQAKTPELLQAYVRDVAITKGGEAWRAMTERGEVLCDYSVSDLAKELSGKECNTLHPLDQFFLGVARARLGVAA
jgi:hypothetical protein